MVIIELSFNTTVSVLRNMAKVQYVVLGQRCPWSATFPNMTNICSLNRMRQKTNMSDDLLISLLPYDKVCAFLLLVKARNSSLLTGRPICLS